MGKKQQTVRERPQKVELQNGDTCVRCGDPINMIIGGKKTYIDFDCYALLLDNNLLEPGEFWEYSREEIDAMFDELNSRLAGMRFDV